MTDNTETPQRNPLSSSSSHTSGTQALSVSIDRDAEDQVKAETSEQPSPSEAAPAVVDATTLVACNENDPSGNMPSASDAVGDFGVEPQGDPATEIEPPFAAGEAEPMLDEAVEPVLPETASELSEAAAAIVEADIPSQPDQGAIAQDLVAAVQPHPAHEAASADVLQDVPHAAAETASAIEGAAEAATEQLRTAVRRTMEQNEFSGEKTLATFDQLSQHVRIAIEDAKHDAARIGFKMMEFAQASVQNHMELARDYAAVRSVPEIFNAQAAYFQRHVDLLNRQTEELRNLTAEIASKKAGQLQSRVRN